MRRKTALSLALALALTAALPAVAAPQRTREESPSALARVVDTIAKRILKVIRAFENPTLPHPAPES